MPSVIRARLARLLRIAEMEPRNEKRRDPLAKRRGAFRHKIDRYPVHINFKCTEAMQQRLWDISEKLRVSQALLLRDAVDFYMAMAEGEYELYGPITAADMAPATGVNHTRMQTK